MKKKSLLAAALAASMVLPSNLPTLSLLTPVTVFAEPGEDPATTEVVLTDATELAITYDSDTKAIKTLTFKAKDADAATTLDAFDGLTLSPQTITVDGDGVVNSPVTVTGTATANSKNVTYKGTFTVPVDNITAATQEPGEDPVKVEVTSWKVEFVEGTNAPAKSLNVTDKVSKNKLALDAYLAEIPEGYHYASKPEEIDFTDVEASGDNKDTKVFTIEIKANANTDVVTPATGAQITVPYTGAAQGTLTVPYKESYTAEDLSKEIKGGTTTDTLSSTDLTPTIYYEDGNSGFKGLEYKAPAITVTEDKEATLDKVDDNVTVAVELPGDLPTLDIPLNQLAEKPAESTLTYEPNYEAISNKLTEDVKAQDKKDPTKQNKLPDYKFKVEPTSTNTDDTQSSNDETISFKAQDLKITITINPSSWIRLLIPAAPKPDAAMVLSDDEVKEAADDTRIPILVQVSRVDKKAPSGVITQDEIQDYIDTEAAAGTLEREDGTSLNANDLRVPNSVELKVNENAPYLYTTTVANGYFEARLDELPQPESTGNNDNKDDSGHTSSGTSRPGKPKPKPEEPVAPVATPTPMYRLYNKLNGEHLFTTDKAERDNLLTSDTWSDEGQGWTAPSVSDTPVYRLLNPNTGDHHYTTDKNEFDTLPTYGWVAEGIAFFSADKNNTENVILHRLYNPNATGAGSHHYTADTNERDTLVAQGWKYEGTAWAGLPANK